MAVSREPSFLLDRSPSADDGSLEVFLTLVADKHHQVLSTDEVESWFETFSDFDEKRDEHAGGHGRAQASTGLMRRPQEMRVSVSKLPALLEACEVTTPDPNSFNADTVTATLYWDSLLPLDSGGKWPKAASVHDLAPAPLPPLFVSFPSPFTHPSVARRLRS